MASAAHRYVRTKYVLYGCQGLRPKARLTMFIEATAVRSLLFTLKHKNGFGLPVKEGWSSLGL